MTDHLRALPTGLLGPRALPVRGWAWLMGETDGLAEKVRYLDATVQELLAELGG
jgi:hypothetical protein